MITLGEGFGKKQLRFFYLLKFSKITSVPNRKIKTSFKSICTFPSFEVLSHHWKSEIVVEALPLYQDGSGIVIGMYHDPVAFIPNHMARWLEHRELEGSPLPGGFYKVKFKVLFIPVNVESLKSLFQIVRKILYLKI